VAIKQIIKSNFSLFLSLSFQAPEAAAMDTANDTIYIRLIRKFITQLKIAPIVSPDTASQPRTEKRVEEKSDLACHPPPSPLDFNKKCFAIELPSRVDCLIKLIL
jgi:hypothetical protein